MFLPGKHILPRCQHRKHTHSGSTYKRFASRAERSKKNPTLKDLDFNELYKAGIILETRTYEVLMDIVKRDCLVLESFAIMDYSLLMGVHNIDMEADAAEVPGPSTFNTSDETVETQEDPDYQSSVRTEAWKSLQLDFNTSRGPHEAGGLPAKNAKGERLLIFLGIIDILQSYKLFKKLEHTWKSVFHDGESISVTNPTFYATRFQQYLREKVFSRAIAIKHTPSVRQQQPQVGRTRVPTDPQEEAAQRLESEPLMSQRGAQDRRSYNTPYGKVGTSSANPPTTVDSVDTSKKRKKERLFAPSDGTEQPSIAPLAFNE